MQRDGETADFLRGLDKRFVTPETEQIFRYRLNTALQDKANEGKNRTDIFAELIKGADGKERTDIFAVQQQGQQQQFGAGPGGNPPPGGDGEPQMQFNFAGIRGRDGETQN